MVQPMVRKDDVCLIICQNVDDKKLKVLEVDANIQPLTGYKPEELIGEDLQYFLPKRIKELIDDYLDSRGDGQGLEEALSKISRFAIVSKVGREIRFSVKIVRDVMNSGDDPKMPRFRLFVRKIRLLEEMQKSAGEQFMNIGGFEKVDPLTGVPDRASFEKLLEMVNYYIGKGEVIACLALLHVDHLAELREKHGNEFAEKALKKLTYLCSSNLREDDRVGQLGPDRYGVIVVDTTLENAKIPLNRIRWMFAADPMEASGQKIPLTLTATYLNMDGRTKVDQMLKTLDEAYEKAARGGVTGNSIIAI